jgi:hypothetical protein
MWRPSWTPWAPQPVERPNVLNLTAGEANVRVPVTVYPQEAPERGAQGGAYGLIPSRPAQVQVVTFYHDQTRTQADSFQATILGPAPHAAVPRGRMAPFGQRANIAVPPHVAYGSLFVQDGPTYGLG